MLPGKFKLAPSTIRSMDEAAMATWKTNSLKAMSAMQAPELFWTDVRRRSYPLFARAIPHVLTIPVTSVACESLFSHASLVLTEKRQRLSDSLLSSLTILHYDKYPVASRLLGPEFS